VKSATGKVPHTMHKALDQSSEPSNIFLREILNTNGLYQRPWNTCMYQLVSWWHLLLW